MVDMREKEPSNPRFLTHREIRNTPQEINMNLFELRRLPTNVDNHANSIFTIESAGFKYHFQSVIHIEAELSAMM